jgi:quinol monooxygenase YgiN
VIVIIVELAVPQAIRARVLEALPRFDAETQREEGCLFFRHAIDVAEPDCLVLSEIWRDQPALVAHFQSPHFTEYRRLSRELGLRPRIRQFEAREIDGDAAAHVRALLSRPEAG